MNPYIKKLTKVEYIITYACTGKCRHCSQGEHSLLGGSIDGARASAALRKIAQSYDLQTVMTFGGEPLLHSDAVYKIMQTAKELDIPKRQVITNGYFTKDLQQAESVAKELFECGVNDLLVSADVFHQRTIPIDAPLHFALCAKRENIPVRVQPAWLQGEDGDNEYDRKTREIMDVFKAHGIDRSDGNIVFFEGSAREYLGEFFAERSVQNPYEENPWDVRCLSFEPNGRVLDGNFYDTDIMEIIERYKP